MKDTNVSGQIIADDEVMYDIERKKRKRIIAVISGVFLILLLGGGISYSVLTSQRVAYDSVADLEANYPNGAAADEVFVVKGKTYRYSTSNKAFVEMKELSDKEKEALDLLDVSLDLTGLEEVKQAIQASGSYDARQGLEGDYISLLRVLRNKAIDNQETVLDYQTNYVYNSDTEKKLNEKLAECEGYLNKLDKYLVDLMGFMNDDKLLFKNELTSLYQTNQGVSDIQGQIDSLNEQYADMVSKQAEMLSWGTDELLKEQTNNINKLKNDLDNINSRIENSVDEATLRELLEKQEHYNTVLKELQAAISQAENSELTSKMRDEINSIYENNLSVINDKIEQVNSRIEVVDNSFEQLQNSTTNVLNQLVTERQDLVQRLGDLEDRLNQLNGNTSDNNNSGVPDNTEEITSITEQISNLYTQIENNNTEIANTLNEYNDTFDKRITQINDVDITDIYQKIKDIQSLIDALNNDITGSDDDLRGLLEEEKEDLLKQLGERYGELKQLLEALDTTTNEKLGVQRDELVSEIDKVNGELSDKLNSTNEIFDNRVNETNTKLAEADNKLTEAIGKETLDRVTELTNTKNELTEQLENTRGDLEEVLANSEGVLSEAIDNTRNELNTTINGVSTDLQAQIDGLNADLNSTINEFVNRFVVDETNITNNANTIAQLRIDLTETQANLVSMQTELNSNINQLRTDMNNADNTLQQSLNGVKDSLTASIADLQAQISSNDTDIADIYSKYNALKTSFEGYVAANNTALTNLTNEFNSYKQLNDTKVNANTTNLTNLTNAYNSYTAANTQNVANLNNSVTEINNKFANYVTTNSLNTALSNYVTVTAAGDYVTTTTYNQGVQSLTGAIALKADITYVDAKVADLESRISALEAKCNTNTNPSRPTTPTTPTTPKTYTYKGNHSCSADVPTGATYTIKVEGYGTVWGPCSVGSVPTGFNDSSKGSETEGEGGRTWDWSRYASFSGNTLTVTYHNHGSSGGRDTPSQTWDYSEITITVYS